MGGTAEYALAKLVVRGIRPDPKTTKGCPVREAVDPRFASELPHRDRQIPSFYLIVTLRGGIETGAGSEDGPQVVS